VDRPNPQSATPSPEQAPTVAGAGPATAATGNAAGATSATAAGQSAAGNKQQRRGRWKFFLILFVCASPLLASYLTYYVIKPAGRTNYGELLDPRLYPIPALGEHGLDGRPQPLESLKGKWLMVTVNGGDCQAGCQKRLHDMRQLQISTGKERERIERVWLITDDAPLDTILIREYDGMRLLRVDGGKLGTWLPATPQTGAADHIYLIDPLGNLMMRYPKDADAARIRKDLTRLLKASAIG
jgi:hypothetical protein